MAIVIYGTDRSRIGGGVRYIVARYDDPSRRAEAEHYLSELRQGSSESYSIDYNYCKEFLETYYFQKQHLQHFQLLKLHFQFSCKLQKFIIYFLSDFIYSQRRS